MELGIDFEDVTFIHNWDGWVTTKEATCAATGKQIRWCIWCGDKQEKTTNKLNPYHGFGFFSEDYVVATLVVDCYNEIDIYRCPYCLGQKVNGVVVHPDYAVYRKGVISHTFENKFVDTYEKDGKVLPNIKANSGGTFEVKAVYEKDAEGNDVVAGYVVDEKTITWTDCEKPINYSILCDNYNDNSIRLDWKDFFNRYAYDVPIYDEETGELIEIERIIELVGLTHEYDPTAIRAASIAAPGHDWGEWILRYPAGEGDNEYSYYWRQCKRCKQVEEQITKTHPDHVHELITVEEAIVEPTCTEAGSHVDVTLCKTCGEVFDEEFVEDPAKGHTPVVVPGYPATTEAPGLTDGEKCSVCGVVLVEQEEIPMIPEANEYKLDTTNVVKSGNKVSGTVAAKRVKGNQPIDDVMLRVYVAGHFANGETFASCSLVEEFKYDAETDTLTFKIPSNQYGAGVVDSVKFNLTTDEDAADSGIFDAIAGANAIA
jgi:hypothetical protein